MTVSLGNVKKEIVVNQLRRDGFGKSLGVFQIADAVIVTVSNRDSDGFVVVDGLQFLPKK